MGHSMPHQERLGKQILPLIQAAAATFGLNCSFDDRLPARTGNLGYRLEASFRPEIRVEIDSYLVGTSLVDHNLRDQDKVDLLVERLRCLSECDQVLVIA
jgi:hypothetical protein